MNDKEMCYVAADPQQPGTAGRYAWMTRNSSMTRRRKSLTGSGKARIFCCRDHELYED